MSALNAAAPAIANGSIAPQRCIHAPSSAWDDSYARYLPPTDDQPFVRDGLTRHVPMSPFDRWTDIHDGQGAKARPLPSPIDLDLDDARCGAHLFRPETPAGPTLLTQPVLA